MLYRFRKIALTGLAAVTGVALVTAATAAAGETRGELLADLDALVETAMAAQQVPGTSVAIVKNGELILARGYGLADVENQVPATEHTVYRIGSVTKQFAAASLLQLVDQGLVELDEPASTYLPDYPWGKFKTTVRQLLDHTSGIKGYTEMPEFWKQGRNDLSHQEMIDLMSSAPLEFEPGDRFQYSNSAYYLVGLIVEKVTGESWADYVEDELFEPLGMRSSHYLYNDPIVPNRAEGYRLVEGELKNDDPLSMYLPYAAGALGSSVSDLMRWLRALTTGEVMSEQSFKAMTTSGKLNDGSEHGYGLGLFVGELDGHRMIEHAGGINGFLSQVAWLPEDDLMIAVLCNSTDSSPGALTASLSRRVLGLEAPQYQAVTQSDKELERYVGLYDAGRNPMPVALVDGVLQVAGQEAVAIGNHRFISPNDPDRLMIFEFEKDPDDKASGLRIERWGQVQKAVRPKA
jgi:CubicO group peptidase (beta-lactamase class C family)